jgi:hypothetical protein
MIAPGHEWATAFIGYRRPANYGRVARVARFISQGEMMPINKEARPFEWRYLPDTWEVLPFPSAKNFTRFMLSRFRETPWRHDSSGISASTSFAKRANDSCQPR